MTKAIGAEQDKPPPEPPGSEFVASSEAADIPLLTLEEKRRILARIARVNPLDCFDDTGAFDIARAKRVLPPGAVRYISVHETTRFNAEGQPVTERRIDVRLVDPVSALRLDDQLERRRERTASSSTSASDADSPPPHPASPEYAHNLLRQKTKELDEAHHTLELLKKALAEANDRQLQLSKELEERDRQLETAQCDTGCQPVVPKHQIPPSETLSSAEEPQALSPSNGQPLSNVESNTLSEAERKAKKRRGRTARLLEQEIEYRRNTSRIGGFNAWLRSKGLDPANYSPPPLPTKSHTARPPP